VSSANGTLGTTDARQWHAGRECPLRAGGRNVTDQGIRTDGQIAATVHE
jgi:hypothetical protein